LQLEAYRTANDKTDHRYKNSNYVSTNYLTYIIVTDIPE